MRSLLVLFVLIASPAFAVSQGELLHCADTKNPEWCLKALQAEEQRQIEQRQLAYEQRMHQQQMELAREQSTGMALFGSGLAAINGMNQGLNNMRLPVQPMPPLQPMAMPFPNAGH